MNNFSTANSQSPKTGFGIEPYSGIVIKIILLIINKSHNIILCIITNKY